MRFLVGLRKINSGRGNIYRGLNIGVKEHLTQIRAKLNGRLFAHWVWRSKLTHYRRGHIIALQSETHIFAHLAGADRLHAKAAYLGINTRVAQYAAKPCWGNDVGVSDETGGGHGWSLFKRG